MPKIYRITCPNGCLEDLHVLDEDVTNLTLQKIQDNYQGNLEGTFKLCPFRSI